MIKPNNLGRWSLAVLAALVLPVIGARAGSQSGYSVLFFFKYTAGGSHPTGPLVLDNSENLYGSSNDGSGQIFEFSAEKQIKALHHFSPFHPEKGERPMAGVIRDDAGNLYGTTAAGGKYARGTIFKLVPENKKLTVLHSFAGNSDGDSPYGGLVSDSEGNMFGTTYNGGPANAGVVYKLASDGKETVLYAFGGGVDGSHPAASLILDGRLNLYGTTVYGGGSGQGTVFKISPRGKLTTLYSFTGAFDGGQPHSALVMDRLKNLYGTTVAGGGQDFGTVYKLTPGGTETIMHDFAGHPDGASPYTAVTMDRRGNLFGTTYSGGEQNQGSVFKISPNGTEVILHSFGGGDDGAAPLGEVALGGSGNLYGNTSFGGGFNVGVLYELTP